MRQLEPAKGRKGGKGGGRRGEGKGKEGRGKERGGRGKERGEEGEGEGERNIPRSLVTGLCTMSVPMQIRTMAIDPSGRGTFARM